MKMVSKYFQSPEADPLQLHTFIDLDSVWRCSDPDILI